MCGIVGYYQFKEEKKLKNLADAVQALNLRGPDAQQIQTFGERCSLGHARLSIIDTSHAADQPMFDSTGRYCIVFNGEIFNFKPLKDKLVVKGYQFQTQSDTEVLLNLYIDLGLDFIKELNGFFAFAIYDSQEETLLLARDRFGIKPLYIAENENRIAFGSELKALKPLLDEKPEIDWASAHLFFQLNYIPGPESIYKNIIQLKPGEARLIKPNDEHTFTFYRINESGNSFKGSYEKAQEQLVNLMEDSVNLRLIADVPLGAFLSGGIDSSVIVALASKHTAKLNTFSIGYRDEPLFDETQYARLVAKKCNTEHTVFQLTNDDLFQHLFDVLDYFDEPFADSSALAVNILCRETRKHATVALSGDGADEIFGGYQKHYGEWRIQNQGLIEKSIKKLGPLLRLMPQSRNSKLTNAIRQASKFSEAASLSITDRYWRLASINSAEKVDKLLAKAIPSHEWSQRKTSLLRHLRGNPNLTGFLHTDCELVLASDMLVKVDRMSMANSLEVRVPFLDYRVVDFAFSLPEEFKVSKKGRKLIVQDAFRSLLPEELYHRPKHGFEVPLLNWFRKELNGFLFDDLLAPKFIEEQQIFNIEQINLLRKKLQSSNPGDSAATLWALLAFQYWFKKWNT